MACVLSAVTRRHCSRQRKHSTMQNNGNSTPAFILLALALLLAGLAIAINAALMPPVGDSWGPLLSGQPGTSATKVITGYLNSYGSSNPRIGQMLMIWGGQVPSLAPWLSLLFLALLTSAAARIVAGQSWYRTTQGLSAALVFLALVWAVQSEIGAMVFYFPIAANHLFGAALSLAFLIPYVDYALSRPVEATAFRLAYVCFLGLPAGMAGEHIGPAVLVFIATLLAFSRLPRKRSVGSWYWLGALFYAIGYLLIFFAPAQRARYSGARYNGFTVDPADLTLSIANAASTVAGYQPLLFLAVFAFLVILLLVGRRRLFMVNPSALIVALFAFFGCLLTGVLTFSPLQAPRIAFAGQAAFAVAGTAVAHWFLRFGPVVPVLLALTALAYLGQQLYLSHGYLKAYHDQFLAQEAAVRSQIAKGETDIRIPPYDLRLDDAEVRRFLWKEFPRWDPDTGTNRMVAAYYKVNSIAFLPDPGVVRIADSLRSGQVAEVVLDHCDPFDANYWRGFKHDPLGAFVCGKTYRLTYDPTSQEWTVSGPRETSEAQPRYILFSKASKGGDPDAGIFVMWGGHYRFDDRGAVFSTRGERVGSLRILSEGAQ